MVPETIDALRILNDHPDTTFTVLTGEGRFFCAGADVRGMFLPSPSLLGLILLERKLITWAEGGLNTLQEFKTTAEKKLFFFSRFAVGKSSTFSFHTSYL
jgi:enoyl-CoA hydratase/carnithine racemase